MNRTTDLRSCSLWRYEIVSEKLYQPDLGDYHTYGIQIVTPEYVYILHDVSVCKKTSEHIVKLLEYHQVSPIHFHDVVTDLLP